MENLGEQIVLSVNKFVALLDVAPKTNTVSVASF